MGGVGPVALAVVTSALDAADQLEPGGDVAPLVGATGLDLDVERPIEVQEIGRLQEHVAELGVRQAGVEAGLDRVLGQHVRDREVLADVAQELEHAHRAEPVVVVDDAGLGRAGREVEEVLELGLDRGGVGDDLGAIEQVALGRLAGWVADHAGAPTHDHHRTAAVALDVHQPEDRDQVPRVERRPARIEPVVGPDRPPGQAAQRGRGSGPGAVPAIRARPAARPDRGRPSSATSQRAGPDRLSARIGGKPVHHRPYAIVAESMQTSLARRRRHRRNGGRPRGGGAASKVAIALPLFLFGTFVLLGLVGANGRSRDVRLLQPGARGPAQAPRHARIRRGDGRLRSDRQDRAGPLRPGQARRGGLRPDPALADRRHDLGRGQDLLGQRRVRPAGDRLGRDRHRPRQRTRRIDHHPAARPGAPAAPERLRGDALRAQDPRDHPVDPAHPGISRDRWQEGHHGRLSQPELLRQPELRDQGRGQELFRDR